MAIGQQDGDVFREIESNSSEWHGGGGETSDENGLDPDAYDLASPDRETQENELSSYDLNGELGDITSYATIRRSYLTVTFGD